MTSGVVAATIAGNIINNVNSNNNNNNNNNNQGKVQNHMFTNKNYENHWSQDFFVVKADYNISDRSNFTDPL